jgi:titin
MLGSLAKLPAATFTVSNVNDSGAGSLRQAILDANAAGDADVIQFQIPGPGPFTINLLAALPPLANPVNLDATTQPGYVNQPLVELNGTSAGLESVGIRVTSSSCSIRGLAINRFATDGIRLESTFNTIQGNFIGTDPLGSTARPNGQYGIFVLGGWSNTIGGTTITARNVIGGGNDTGIFLLNCFGNTVQGNFIGVAASGTVALGNTNNGITLFAAENNLIGGTTAGARNVIAGNQASGINVNATSSTGNVIQGNYIGVNAAGTTVISNTADGITLNDAVGNQIGGITAGAGNVISGNGQAGIFLNGANCRANFVQGNLIGTDSAGAVGLGNRFAGITLAGAISNTIGGVVSTARNVISGNFQEGIFFSANSRSNRVFGNYIGTAASGTTALPNQASGIALNNAADNFIGGSNPGEGNVISGNNFLGVWLLNTNATRNLVRGNLIGVGATGSSAVGNAQAGVGISDAGTNQIGGAGSLERNVISGNGYPANGGGVFILGSRATGNKLLGNRIGTDSNGTAALPNRFDGVYLVNAHSNTIGGFLAGEGNQIAGNTTRGMRLTNSLANDILGNFFGVKPDGTNSLANGQFNIELEEFTSFTRIGAAAGGGNRIGYSGGIYAGVRVRDHSTNNAILGNAIFNSASLGIDLGTFGGSSNDDCDGDGGANQLQNFPVLTQAFGGGAAGIRGTFNSKPNQTYRLQFFASASCNASGNGEGAVYLGDKIISTGAACSTNFVVSLPSAVAVGSVLTATATDAANNTSEFSACLTASAPPELQIAPDGGSALKLTWPAASGFVLREAASLTPPITWTLVTNVPVNLSGQLTVAVTPQGSQRFYRLSFE